MSVEAGLWRWCRLLRRYRVPRASSGQRRRNCRWSLHWTPQWGAPHWWRTWALATRSSAVRHGSLQKVQARMSSGYRKHCGWSFQSGTAPPRWAHCYADWTEILHSRHPSRCVEAKCRWWGSRWTGHKVPQAQSWSPARWLPLRRLRWSYCGAGFRSPGPESAWWWRWRLEHLAVYRHGTAHPPWVSHYRWVRHLRWLPIRQG